jgi:hypothetical protein
MKRSIFAILAIAVLLVGLLAGCKKDDGFIDKEEALQIVLDKIGMTQEQANPHVHVTEVDGLTCWNIYVTVEGKSMEYVVHSLTGEILSVKESNHSH